MYFNFDYLQKDGRLLSQANSANNNCRPFQVKINCSKFIIGGLQQQGNMTLSVSLFVTSRNLLFGVSLLWRKVITNNLKKITINFRQVPLKCVLFSIRIHELEHELLHKWVLRLPVRFLLPIHGSLFVSYMVFIFIFVKSISSRLVFGL